MIEISARLSRGPVYFTNETIKCIITFKNVNSVLIHNNCNNNTNNSTSDRKSTDLKKGEVETLCWAGVQIHCYCTTDETKVLFNELDAKCVPPITSTDTSFNPCLMKGEKGRVIYASKPKILFCDLKLTQNESKTFVYYETIPEDCVPSYNGTKVKYQYKLSIGTQRVNSTIQLLRIPIRILSISNNKLLINSNNSNNDIEYLDESKRKDSLVSNQSLTSNCFDSDESVLDLSLHRLDCLTAKRCPYSYVITNQFGKVAKFCVLKSTYKLGEDIVGIFNFTETTVPCVQFSVTLQSEEVIEEEYRSKQGKPSSFTHTTSYGKYNDFSLHMRHMQMILSIPLTVTPTFTSDIISLSWKLHFEFVTTRNEDIKNTIVVDSEGVMEQSPAILNVQTMVWDLPIVIFATHPIQIARGFQIPAASTLTV